MRYEDLVDNEGENQAVRAFLMLYGSSGSGQIKITSMKAFLISMGFDEAWPDWANDNAIIGLTKSGAQLWLRYLFDLEEK